MTIDLRDYMPPRHMNAVQAALAEIQNMHPALVQRLKKPYENASAAICELMETVGFIPTEKALNPVEGYRPITGRSTILTHVKKRTLRLSEQALNEFVVFMTSYGDLDPKATDELKERPVKGSHATEIVHIEGDTHIDGSLTVKWPFSPDEPESVSGDMAKLADGKAVSGSVLESDGYTRVWEKPFIPDEVIAEAKALKSGVTFLEEAGEEIPEPKPRIKRERKKKEAPVVMPPEWGSW